MGGAGAARFRSDLEGLRAVAVGLVLLYHAQVPGFTGGFVGVDVFFVLSGFLITGLLVRELSETGRVSLPAFYARRARRLLPAAAVCLVVTVAVSAVVLPPLRVPDVAADAAAAALYVSNIRFAVQATDYLAADLAPSPLLHFWSLGVEEQFYLFWPAFLAVAAGASFAAGDPARGLRRLTLVVGGTLVASFGLSLWLTEAAAPWAFFSLPTRAWELAIGGLLALPIARRSVPGPVAAIAGWAGVGLVVLAGLALGTATPFPGWAALLPTVGTALVIFAGGATAASAASGTAPATAGMAARLAPARVLALAPFRFVGRISYSLYLWHWPLLVLPAAALEQALPGPVRVGLVLLAVPLAAASQRWIEDPVRHGRLARLAPGRTLRLAGVLTVAVGLTSVSIGLAAGATATAGPVVGGGLDEVPLPTAVASAAPSGGPSPSAPSAPSGSPGPGPSASASTGPVATLPPTAGGPVPADLAPALRAARDDLPRTYGDGCHVPVPVTEPPDCVYGDAGSTTTIVLFGDSHAAQWFPAMERIATEQGLRLLSFTKSSCPSADVTVWNGILRRAYTECDAWRDAALKRIAAERPSLVVTTNSRDHALIVDGATAGPGTAEDAWAAGLRATLDRLKATAGNVVLLGDTPRSDVDPPVCLSAHLKESLACATPFDAAVGMDRLVLEAAVAGEAGARFLDPTPWVCPSGPCPVVVGRFLVYRDDHHMTATYARGLSGRLGAVLSLPSAAPPAAAE